MNDHRELQSAHPATSGPSSAEQKPGRAKEFPARPRRSVLLAAFAALASGAAWVIGRTASHRIEGRDIESASHRQAPLPGIRQDPHAAINAGIVSKKQVANLDGTAVAYEDVANGLIAPDGRFRTNLSPREAAAILRLDAEAIAKKGSPLEIDRDAILFRAQSGKLTDKAKTMSRKRRREQAAGGRTPDAVYGEWDVQDFAFTLNRLKHPSEEEKVILAAIVRWKLLVVPKPGDTIRATFVARGEIGPDRVALSPGMLPPEAPLALP